MHTDSRKNGYFHLAVKLSVLLKIYVFLWECLLFHFTVPFLTAVPADRYI